jgi:hypothetical protein
MSKYRYSLNLQLFAEDDDDFSDDFDSQPEDDEFADENEVESEEVETDVEDTTPAEEPEQPTEPAQEQKLKLKFNHEEREISLEEATALAQKGMNYEKAIERARQEAAQQARDSVIAEQGHEWNGKPITTEAQYKDALAEQALINKYQDSNLPDEVIQELMEGRKDREARAKEKAAQEEETKKTAQVNDFLDYFQRVNERAFDGAKDAIPQEVKDAVDRGDTLKIAYMEYHNNQLRNQLKIAKQNEANSKKAPVGSVTANGSNKTEAVDPFLAAFDED